MVLVYVDNIQRFHVAVLFNYEFRCSRIPRVTLTPTDLITTDGRMQTVLPIYTISRVGETRLKVTIRLDREQLCKIRRPTYNQMPLKKCVCVRACVCIKLHNIIFIISLLHVCTRL